jgi:hypothetical protein
VPGANRSLNFDGTNDYARLTDVPTATTFTIEAWVRRTVDRNRYETIVADANSGYSQLAYSIFVDGASRDCGAGDQFGFYSLSEGAQCSGVSATLNQWFHVAVSRDASGVRRMFVNGNLVSTRAGSAAPGNSTGRLAIGRAGDYNGEYFGGQVDEVRLSNVARYTATFVVPNTAFVGDANTVGLWHLNEGTGQTVGDSSGNGRNGLLGGSTSVQTADPSWSSVVPF